MPLTCLISGIVKLQRVRWICLDTLEAFLNENHFMLARVTAKLLCQGFTII